MRILSNVDATPEQLKIVARDSLGVFLIRGAAGSGKTTTALLRLRQQCRSWRRRHGRMNTGQPVRVLVLTYNRTLQGFIAALAQAQVAEDPNVEMTITTFAKWSRGLVNAHFQDINLIDDDDRSTFIQSAVQRIGLDGRFGSDEVEYAMGRFLPKEMDKYLDAERTGRGKTPRVGRELRSRILNEVIVPYRQMKKNQGVYDWNDLAVIATQVPSAEYDVVIADEAQDFSANQMRAIMHHLAPEHSATFVIDAVQRIYPRFFTWVEAGVPIEKSFRLETNHRNTREIAEFAAHLVKDLPAEDDGTTPDFESAARRGDLPTVLVGKFSDQMRWVVDYLRENVDLERESVAFLHPLGGGFFSYIKQQLTASGLEFCQLTRASTWPRGPENIALCTINSAKGLEFNHVIIVGLNNQVTPHGPGDDDAALDRLRRLVAMGIGRARDSVVIGYKPEDPSRLIELFKPGSFNQVNL